MEEEKGSFKGRLFGGFDRQDVINYIEASAAEFNAVEAERDSLLTERDALLAERDELSETIEELESAKDAALAALSEEKDAEIAALTQEKDALAAALAEEKKRTESIKASELREAETAVAALITKCAQLKADMGVNIAHTRKRIDADLDGVTDISDELETRLNRLLERIRAMAEG